MLTTDQVVDYILARSVDRPCPMKLQKLLYYVQGYCLALRGEPMFDAEFEAWMCGPVVPIVHHRYDACRDAPIDGPVSIVDDAYGLEDVELLSAVLATYARLPSGPLSAGTLREPPWRDAFGQGGRSAPITRDALAKWFDVLVDQKASLIRRDQFHHQKRRRIAERMGRHRDKLAALAERNKGLDPWADED